MAILKLGQFLLISWGQKHFTQSRTSFGSATMIHLPKSHENSHYNLSLPFEKFPHDRALIKVKAIMAHSWNTVLSTIIFILQVR